MKLVSEEKTQIKGAVYFDIKNSTMKLFTRTKGILQTGITITELILGEA